MTRTSRPRSFAELVEAAVPQLSGRMLAQRVRSSWPSLAGPEAARRSRPSAINGDVLQVTVDNSPWLHELTLRSEELTDRVRAAFPGVRGLRFALGHVSADDPSPASVVEPDPPELSVAELQAIDHAAAAIQDPALAHAARRLLTKGWRSASPRGGA